MPMPPDLEKVVQTMLDKGESEENISSVIQHYKQVHAPQAPDRYKGPTSFMGGVIDSFKNGQVGDAVDKSAGGWLDSIAGVPGNIASGLSNAAQAQFHAMTDPNYIPNTLEAGIRKIPEVPGMIGNALHSAYDTTMQAGSHPEEFGHMMGDVTGQPAAMELMGAGAGKLMPSARTIGRGMENVGNMMAEHQPISGMVPHAFDMRTARNLEEWAGNKIAGIGSRTGIPLKTGEVVSAGPDFNEGAIIPNDTKSLPSSNTSFYSPDSFESPTSGSSMEGDFGPIAKPQLALPASNPPFYMGDGGTMEPQSPIIGGYGQTLSPSINPAIDPLQGASPGAGQRMLPPASGGASYQLPESSLDTSRFEPPAQIIGNQNSPAMPHDIPEETIPDTIKIPPKNMNPQLIKYAKGKGYTFVGYDQQGNVILKVPSLQ